MARLDVNSKQARRPSRRRRPDHGRSASCETSDAGSNWRDCDKVDISQARGSRQYTTNARDRAYSDRYHIGCTSTRCANTSVVEPPLIWASGSHRAAILELIGMGRFSPSKRYHYAARRRAQFGVKPGTCSA